MTESKNDKKMYKKYFVFVLPLMKRLVESVALIRCRWLRAQAAPSPSPMVENRPKMGSQQ